jgi:hypothetical protein
MNDGLKLKGNISIKLYDKDGNLKDERDINNVIVTVGKNYLAAWLAAASQAGKFMSYVALGEGTTPAAAEDDDMEDPLSPRILGTLSANNSVWQSIAVYNPGVCTGAITEAGLFSAITAGTMFAHQVFGTITKTELDSLTLTWQVTIS